MIPDFTDIRKSLEACAPSGKLPPSREATVDIIKDAQHLMFPEYFAPSGGKARVDIDELYLSLKAQICTAMDFCGACACGCEGLAEEIIRALPEIRNKLYKDIEALYRGDPAASRREEVIIAYPGFLAISIYRIAHEFYTRGIPLIPRIMTEYAHEKTGIDINAGAKIGEYFFIDHGTGIVIGETTTIGNNVKIYQGVTLGAKSFDLDEGGDPIKGIKRHPDIGNNVIIYANATILGGNTVIGDGAVIGGNVWLTSSVEAGKTVYYKCK